MKMKIKLNLSRTGDLHGGGMEQRGCNLRICTNPFIYCDQQTKELLYIGVYNRYQQRKLF